MSAPTIGDRVDALDAHEYMRITYLLLGRHPRILKSLLDEIDKERQKIHIRKTMPPHPVGAYPYAGPPGQGSASLCWWRHDGVLCLRTPADPLHTEAPVDTNGGQPQTDPRAQQ